MIKGIQTNLEELLALRHLNINLNLKSPYHSQRNGHHHSKIRGRGMDFSEVRRYQAGDDVRHMQWRVTAKTGLAHVKLYQEEKERPVFFVCDFNPSMYFATKQAFKSVMSAKICALLAWHFERLGDRVGGIFFSGDNSTDLNPQARRRGVLSVLNALLTHANQHSQKTKPLSEILYSLRKVARPGSLIIFISDFYSVDQDAFTWVRKLRTHSSLLAIQIKDPIEEKGLIGGLYPIANRLGKSALLNTYDGKTRVEFESFFKEIDQRFADLFLASERFKVSTDDKLSDILSLLSSALPNQRVSL